MTRRVLNVMFVMALLLLLTNVASYAQGAPPSDPVALLAWLKGNILVLQLLVGFAWKYLPFMKSFSNNLIPWVNVVVFVISVFAGVAVAANVAAPVAPVDVVTHRGFFSVVLLGFLHSGVAKILYDGWLKPALDNTVGKLTGTV